MFGVEISAPKQPTSLKPRSRAKGSRFQHLDSITRQIRDSTITIGQDDQKVGTFRAALVHCGGSLARRNGETRFVRERSILSPGKLFLPDRPHMANSFILVSDPQCGGSSPIVTPVPNAEIRWTWCAAAVDQLHTRKDHLGARYDAPRIANATRGVHFGIPLGVLLPLDTTFPPSLPSYRAPISQYPDTIAPSTSSSRCEALGSALRYLKLHSPRGPEWAYFRCRCI
jgi:hypothetical protein